MKANKIFSYLQDIVNSSDMRVQLRWIYFIAIIGALLNLVFIGWKLFPDSQGYVSAWDIFLSGRIDGIRTPVYPFFLGCIRSIIGSTHLYWGAVVAQIVIFLLSVRYFYKLARVFTSRSSISFWVTIIYCLVPGIISWNNIIMTESLAISGSVFLFYFAIEAWKNQRKYSFVGFGISLLLLSMLRPSLLYLLPLFFCFWLVAFFVKGKKKAGYCGLGCVVIATALFLIYCFSFQKTYGLFSPSVIGTLNQFCIARQRDLLKPDVIQNAAMKADIEKMLASGKGDTVDKYYGEFHELEMKYSLPEIQKVLTLSFRSDLGQFLKGMADIAAYTGNRNVLGSFVSSSIVKIKMNFIYFFILIYAVFLVFSGWRRKKLPVLSLLIYGAVFANIVMVLAGAQEEWPRLLVPSMPLFFLMFAQLLSALGLKIELRKDNLFQLE